MRSAYRLVRGPYGFNVYLGRTFIGHTASRMDALALCAAHHG